MRKRVKILLLFVCVMGQNSCVTGFVNGARLPLYLISGDSKVKGFKSPEEIFPSGGGRTSIDIGNFPLTVEYITAPLFPATFVAGMAGVIVALPIVLPLIGLEELGVPIVRSKYEIYLDKIRMAENPDTPPEILEELANHDYEKIRRGVAENPNIPPKLLKKLTSDPDPDVRKMAIARSPDTPPEVLEKLIYHSGYKMEKAVAENPNTSPKVLEQLSRSRWYAEVREAVARNSNTPPRVLQKLASDPDSGVRKAVAKNPNTPPEVLKKLSDGEKN